MISLHCKVLYDEDAKVSVKKEHDVDNDYGVCFKTKIASRGWHFYGKTTWKTPKKGQKMLKTKKTKSH